jgi:hypothetical protein
MMSVTFFSACDFCYVHVGLDDGDILVMFFYVDEVHGGLDDCDWP